MGKADETVDPFAMVLNFIRCQTKHNLIQQIRQETKLPLPSLISKSTNKCLMEKLIQSFISRLSIIFLPIYQLQQWIQLQCVRLSLMKAIKKYFQALFGFKMPEKQILKEIHAEITGSLAKAYQCLPAQKYLDSLPVPALLHKSVQLYIGSRATPRNEQIMRMLLDKAEKKARKQGQPDMQNLVDYYLAYYVKMQAMKNGNDQEYERSSQMFMELSQKGDHLSSYLSGKEFYRLLQTGRIDDWSDKQLIENTKKMFSNSICDRQLGGLFYLADIEQKQATLQDRLQQVKSQLFEMYVQAASLGYPLAYFKLAQAYREKGNQVLYKKYLMMAAENGVMQAQHNLAIQYSKGEYFPKDELKSFSWFLHAAAHGFNYSKYNLSRILIQGSTCGRILPNPKAALLYLEQINRSGQINVEQDIKELVKRIQSS